MAGGNYLEYAYLKGEIIKFEDANIPIATNALQYGTGLFGGIKGYLLDDGSINIFQLERHAQRLVDSAKILRFSFEMSPAQISEKIVDLTKRNTPHSNIYIRPFIYRSDTGLGPNLDGDFDLAVYMLAMGDYYDKTKGLRAMVSSWQRNSDLTIPPRTKASGGYINSALATNDAKAAGYDAAIMMDGTGHISEGAVMNIYTVRDGKIITTGVTSDILEGITRRKIIEVAHKLGIEVEQRPIDRSELYTADEVFFSGTATEITWCESIDSVPISDSKGEITTRLEEEFYKLTMTDGTKVTF